MRIYIAAPYQLRHVAVEMRADLTSRGHVITSRWLMETHDVDEKLSDERNAVLAHEDIQDIRAADTVLALNPPGWESKGTGGRHFEFGVALILGKSLILFGVRSNAFHYLSEIRVIERLEDL